MHTDRSNVPPSPQQLADDAIPRRRLLAWVLAFAVMALGVVLYFIYHARVSPLLD